MSDPLTALALTGASAIVTALATSAWDVPRRQPRLGYCNAGRDLDPEPLRHKKPRPMQDRVPDAVRELPAAVLAPRRANRTRNCRRKARHY